MADGLAVAAGKIPSSMKPHLYRIRIEADNRGFELCPWNVSSSSLAAFWTQGIR